MSIEIKVPMLPESVADALLLDWQKQVGDAVARDEILVEVETDKVVLEVPAPQDGTLVEIVAQSGDTVLAEQVLARFEAGVADAPKASVAAGSASAPTPAAVATESAESARSSPAVRNLLEQHHLDPAVISGSGKGGRLLKEDVLRHIDTQGAPSTPPLTSTPSPTTAPPAMPSPPPSGAREQTRQPMSRLRRTIAARLVQSQQNAALLTTFNEVNMHAVMTLRAKYRDEFEQKHGARLGFMSFFVKASVVALQRFPLVNGYIDGTDIVQHNYYDIGLAVASPRGLVVPVLRNCETLSMRDIEVQIRDLGVRAGQGKIMPDELSGGTFTITNGGVFGSLLSTPIVNPPQSAILGMHRIQDRPVAENGEVVVRPMMYLALSYDHRIVDGKEAVQFLVTVRELLEDPAKLLLDI